MTSGAPSSFDADVTARDLAIAIVELTPGHAVVRMRVEDRMVNGHGLAHGGYVFLLADTAFAYACNSHGPATVAAGAEITFVAAARQGEELVATADERTRFGRNGIYDVTVHRHDAAGPTVIAEFRGRSRTIEQASP